MADSGLC